MPTLMLDKEELWVLHEWVRRERGAPSYGEEHDLSFVQKLWGAILAEEPVVEVDLSRGELLQITRQVSTLLAMGPRPIGKEILKKAFAALLERESEERCDVPNAFHNAIDTDPDPDKDDAGGRADAPAEPGRNLRPTETRDSAQDRTNSLDAIVGWEDWE